MSHYCEFCQVEHSSGSCYHPGNHQLKELQKQLEEYKMVAEHLDHFLERSSKREIRYREALVKIEKFGHGRGHGRGYTCANMAQEAIEGVHNEMS